MSDLILKKITRLFKERWSSFEEILLLPSHDKDFHLFLNSYCGVDLAASSPAISHLSSRGLTLSSRGLTAGSTKFTQLLKNHFESLFAESQLLTLESTEIEKILFEFEKNINLILYYWFGLDDKNYQFRTCIHFLKLSQFQVELFQKKSVAFCLFLSANGIGFTSHDKQHIPNTRPSSKLYQLKILASESDVISEIRCVQREICLLIEEWEYLNSIYAIEFRSGKNPFAKRNQLAIWILESFCDFQKWISELNKQHDSQDVKSEYEALAALVLSATQKILLPASISRICYPQDVIVLLEKFAKNRLEYMPHDYSTKLMLQATQSAQGSDFASQLLDILNLKPHEWKLSFDPNNIIKSFSWSYSSKHHLLLCALTGICYFKKTAPKKLDPFFLSEISYSVQSKDSFAFDGGNHKIHDNPCSLSCEQTQIIFSTLIDYLENNLNYIEGVQEQIEFLKQIFKVRKGDS
jgi:hypothetical protein